MIPLNKLDGVWFVYDGECPICEQAAKALRIKQSLGDLHLLDARSDTGHPLLAAINQKQLDLDEGMVIFHRQRFYHGKTALWFMSVYGAPQGLFNHINRLFFRFEPVARALYPVMRAGRNLLLKLRGKSKIRNLQKTNLPIFQPVFGDAWKQMPPIMHAHYANRAFSNDLHIAKGQMKVEAGRFLRLLAPVSRLFGGIPAYNQSNIPVEVRFESEPDGPGLVFNRTFKLHGMKPYVFRSTMVPIGDNLMVEKMKFGLCWRVRFSWHNKQVKLAHAGYALNFFGTPFTVPLNWLLGSIDAHEKATGPNSFAMAVMIRHPLWGTYYSYSGEFTMVSMKEAGDD